MLFQKLLVWRDSVARSGFENMAIDEWLIRQVGELPVLRLYKWAGDWVSLGYFQSLSAGKAVFGENPQYVRRWTGGGVVDHREDVTYSLMIPRSHPLALAGGGQSYLKIHEELCHCLKSQGDSCELVPDDDEIDSVACFEKPVKWDVLRDGQKIAGAGQRRTREGILHQGSVLTGKADLRSFADFLAESTEEWSPELPLQHDLRYESPEWLERVR